MNKKNAPWLANSNNKESLPATKLFRMLSFTKLLCLERKNVSSILEKLLTFKSWCLQFWLYILLGLFAHLFHYFLSGDFLPFFKFQSMYCAIYQTEEPWCKLLWTPLRETIYWWCSAAAGFRTQLGLIFSSIWGPNPYWNLFQFSLLEKTVLLLIKGVKTVKCELYLFSLLRGMKNYDFSTLLLDEQIP